MLALWVSECVCVHRMLDEGLLTLPFSTSFSSTFQLKDKFWKQNNEGNKMTQFWKQNVLQSILCSNISKNLWSHKYHLASDPLLLFFMPLDKVKD